MVTFAAIGTVSFVCDVSLYALFTRVAGIYFLAANVLSFALAGSVGFFLNRRFTFPHGERGGIKQYARFFGVALTGLALNTLFLWLLVIAFGIHDIVAKFIAAAIVFLWNFSLQRYWTFRIRKVYTTQ